MSASVQAEPLHTILLAGVRHLDKLQSQLRTAGAIIDPSEATDYQNAMFMLGAARHKINELENLHRAIDIHFRELLQDVHNLILQDKEATKRAAAELAEKLPPVETETQKEESQDAAA